MGLSSPHTHLVVSGRGVPHEPLTLFYEELQKRCEAQTLQANMSLLLSFFSFLEERQSLCEVTLPRVQEEWSARMEAMEMPSFPASMAWAGPPSQLQAAVRFYLAARFRCRTRQQGRYEDILLSPFMQGEQQLSLFLAVLRQFYRFARERRDYWYESNPIEAFRLPLHSRLLHTITAMRLSLWSWLSVSWWKGRKVIRARSRHVGMKLMASLKERTLCGADRKWTSSPQSGSVKEKEGLHDDPVKAGEIPSRFRGVLPQWLGECSMLLKRYQGRYAFP